MKLLLDTSVLLWASFQSSRLPPSVLTLLADPANQRVFSVVSIWEITIKRALGRQNFQIDPHLLRRGLIDNGYEELPVTGRHALAIDQLPPIHKDPFDRLLIAQSIVEGISLLTSDARVALYPGPITSISKIL